MKLKSIVLIPLLMSSLSFAQQYKGLVASSEQARRTTSTDLNRLVEIAFPDYNDAALEKQLTEVAKELGSRSDSIKVRSIEGVEGVMGFPASTLRANEIDTKNAYYRIDPVMQKVFALHKDYSFKSSSREDFASMRSNIINLHNRFINNLGVPRDELMKVVFKEVAIQVREEDSTDDDTQEIRVRRGMSLAYRGFKGIPIEGSFLRVSSFTPKRVENFGLAWPRFALHPHVLKIKLASKESIKRNILDTIKAHVKTNQEVSVNMGVVYHQVNTVDGRLVHVPGMKVVITPVEQQLDGDATVTNAGQEFFAKMLLAQPVIRNDEKKDSRGSATN